MNGELMAAEMAEQPTVLRNLIERRGEIVGRMRAAMPQPLCGMTLVARGSSDNAALYGRYLLEMASGRPVGLAAPSIHTVYGAAVDLTGYLAIGISQSGETPEIVTVLRRSREQGARAVAVVNRGGSPLAEVADSTIELEAGVESAVPATKTFTATLAALALMAGAVGNVPWREADVLQLPVHMEGILADTRWADDLAAELDGSDRLLAVGRGLFLVTALEAALKVRETTGILAEGISPADLRHGPIAAVTPGFPVVWFGSNRPGGPEAGALLSALTERGARIYRVGPQPDAECALPAPVPEALLPLLGAVRAQQLAAALARRRHLDPDAPLGLSKVTLTR
jgi:glucosamine--fructose-6-phosphate aminotransferase (isomerizing)